MSYIFRKIKDSIDEALNRGKSILLLGARQTGKTTFIEKEIQPDISYSFLDPEIRIRYEKDPTLLFKELKWSLQQRSTQEKPPLIFIDEVQKIPHVMDAIQLLINQKKAQFILTGSSARKLKKGPSINLLPGRVINLTMDPFHWDELPLPKPDLKELLLYGTLPLIITNTNEVFKETDLFAYTTIYLEEEIRSEALVRNIGHFSRFLEVAASESGHIINFTKLSQDVGVAASTIIDYYNILEDCLVAIRIDPIIHTTSRRRLIKAPKYLFFDLGVRRACAQEGINTGSYISDRYFPHLFEQYIGIELIHQMRRYVNTKLYYWRDSGGVEVDFVVEREGKYIPIEVKWTDAPSISDARHLKKFLNEYENASLGYVICRTPHAFELAENIIALPWQEIVNLFL
jgi:predicted AAA+ superfamily ATPase